MDTASTDNAYIAPISGQTATLMYSPLPAGTSWPLLAVCRIPLRSVEKHRSTENHVRPCSNTSLPSLFSPALC